MDSQEVTFVKAKTVILQTALGTKFPYWLLVALLDSVKADLLGGLYQNAVITKEADDDATGGPAEQHNGDATQE